MLGAQELKALLRTRGLRLTKRLGQHHLIDARVLERIASSCQLACSDTVVEIGAGLGALTEPLARRAGRVLAVEVDRKIGCLLGERLASWPNVTVACEDILQVSAERLRGAVLVGAIPYSITSPILVWLSERRQAIRRAILVLQAELADRVMATPGSRAYGRLSLLCQHGWELTPLFDVPRSAFFPQPDVDSRCLRLVPRVPRVVAVQDEPFLFEVIKAAFAQRRKTLANSLAAQRAMRLTRPRIEAALERLGLPRTVRGETLSLAQFASLAEILKDDFVDSQRGDAPPRRISQIPRPYRRNLP